MDFELVLGECAPQIRVERAPRLRLGAKDRLEMPANAAAVGLRLIEREISVGDQLIDGHPVVRGDRDAGAAADVQHVISDRGMAAPAARALRSQSR